MSDDLFRFTSPAGAAMKMRLRRASDTGLRFEVSHRDPLTGMTCDLNYHFPPIMWQHDQSYLVENFIDHIGRWLKEIEPDHSDDEDSIPW